MVKHLSVGGLKKLLEELPDEAPVIVPSPDHEYRNTSGFVGTALWDKETRIWTEDRGEDVTPEADYGKRLKVLIIQ